MSLSDQTHETSPGAPASLHERRAQHRGPASWPLAGHALSMLRSPLRFVTSLPAYGDVVPLRLGSLPVYAVTHPELIRQILVDQAHRFERGRFFEKAKLFVGPEGLAVTSGTAHLHQRRALQPLFHRERIAAFNATMRRAVEDVTASWQSGATVAVDQDMNRLALTVLTRTLLSGELGDHATTVFQRSLPVLSRGLIARTVLPEWYGRIPTPGNHRFHSAIQSVDNVIANAIRSYRQDDRDRGDLLSMLMAPHHETGRRWSDQQIRDQVLTFLTAGVETTGAILAWIFHELGNHPTVEQRIHDELDHVLGGSPPEPDTLADLEYTGRVIKETLRRYPLWMTMRRTKAPVRLGSVTVPAGIEVLYSPYGLHHDPRWFPQPGSFTPDRWLPQRTHTIPKGAYLPFGQGGHHCIGASYSLTEIATAIAVICQRWRLRPLPNARITQIARTSVHPNHLPMIAETRFWSTSRRADPWTSCRAAPARR
ncbi:cytochrome P450 [Streptomyces cinnamoneus]|uniref:cytochrome P450 n=1 Tax=Streptomyces cinnamoneus TaxID=53446 RepID=UPI0033DB60C3